MRQLLLLCLLIITGKPSFAQETFSCATDQMRRQLIAEHPEILQEEARLEAFIQDYIATHQFSQRSGPIIIPLVFHIIHRGGAENISDLQVLDAVRILNEDFNAMNADLSQVIPELQSIIGNAGIEFRLATIDPSGKCTNGIEHVYSSQTYEGNDFSKLNPWPREKYMNIWVVDKLGGGAAGYAYYPGSMTPLTMQPMKDGVIILQDYIGSIGTSSAGRSRALTHELGHCLNLKHTWGDSNEPGVMCGDDHVNDTPLTKGFTSCPTPNNSMICTPGVKENFQNFMDYSYCSKMFSDGQGLRMLATLNSSTSDRNNLWTAANLAATGTENLTASACAPKADFSVNRQYICIGTPVTFKDNSYNGSIDSRLWGFSNADIDASSDPSPVVTFQSVGWQTVTLDVLNITGSDSKTQTLVYVSDPNSQYPTPYYNSFEDASEFDNWACINVDHDLTSFQRTSIASHSGSAAILLDNYKSRNDHNIDELVSPAFDCSNLGSTDANLSFYLSYASWGQYSSHVPLADSMVIYASKNCGGTWSKIFAKASYDIVNAANQQGYYVPGSQYWPYWQKLTTTIPTTFRAQNVRFKVQVFGAHNSNNFYLDDWNIGNAIVSGIEEQEQNHFSAMPNPFKGLVTIKGLNADKYTVEVMDLTGRKVSHFENANANNGILQLDLSAIQATGLYMVRLSDKTGSQTLKLLKE